MMFDTQIVTASKLQKLKKEGKKDIKRCDLHHDIWNK